MFVEWWWWWSIADRHYLRKLIEFEAAVTHTGIGAARPPPYSTLEHVGLLSVDTKRLLSATVKSLNVEKGAKTWVLLVISCGLFLAAFSWGCADGGRGACHDRPRAGQQ